MANNYREHMKVIGFFQPHAPYDWHGLVCDPKTGELVKEPSMTKQSFKDECDINNIVRDFTRTGQIAHINERQAQFADLPDGLDYQSAVEIARAGQAAFDALPAQIRARFHNDPEEFLNFFHDPKNQDEAIELGLATRRPGTEVPGGVAQDGQGAPKEPSGSPKGSGAPS